MELSVWSARSIRGWSRSPRRRFYNGVVTATTAPSLFLALLAGYVLLMVYLAWAGKRRTRGVADYFVGGRSLGGWILGLSYFATYASTNSYLGFSGKSYQYGLVWLLLVPCAVGFCLMGWLWVAPRLREVTGESGALTIPEFVGLRYDSLGARRGAAVIVVFSSFLYMTAVYKGIGTLLGELIGVSYPAAIGLVLVVVVLYTSVGGFHSVVRTDAVQAVFMVVAALLLARGVLEAAGGWGALSRLRESAETAHLFEFDRSADLLVVGVVVASTIKLLVEPRQLTRFLALSRPKDVRAGTVVATLCFLVVFTLLAPIGILAHAMSADLLPANVQDTDRIVPVLLASGELFSPLVVSLLMLAMLSAALSSLDSVLLVLASSVERDLLDPTGSRASERTVGRTRAMVVAFAAVTALIALRPPGGIVELTSFSGALYGACFLPALLFGLYGSLRSSAGVLASFVVGALVLVVWPRSGIAGIHAVFPAVAISLTAYAVTAVLAGDRIEEVG